RSTLFPYTTLFRSTQENIVFLGPSGVGKTHLATSIKKSQIQQHQQAKKTYPPVAKKMEKKQIIQIILLVTLVIPLALLIKKIFSKS
ncbi:hypothetical protein CBC3_01365, partial [Clostridium botulinum V891]